MSTKITTATEHAITAIKKAPRNGTNICWAADLAVPTLAAIAILTCSDQDAAIRVIAGGASASANSLRSFARGNKSDGTAWHDLRKALSDADCKWNDNPPGRPRRIVSNGPATTIVPPAAFEVTPPVAKAPVADTPPAPIASLAVTNKGEVITVAPPVAATAPSPMVAKPGEFAVKECATRYVLDTKTNAILAITTKRIEYGTPEWCAKMVEINSKPKT